MVRRYVRKGAKRYPWREWFKKKSFKLFKGVDYEGRTYAMAQQVRNAAKLPQYHVRVSIVIAEDDNSIEVYVEDRE
jgi:hypothetical protein